MAALSKDAGDAREAAPIEVDVSVITGGRSLDSQVEKWSDAAERRRRSGKGKSAAPAETQLAVVPSTPQDGQPAVISLTPPEGQLALVGSAASDAQPAVVSVTPPEGQLAAVPSIPPDTQPAVIPLAPPDGQPPSKKRSYERLALGVAIAALVVAGLAVVRDEREDRREQAQTRRAAAADLDVEFIVLPRPAVIRLDEVSQGLEAQLQKVNNYFGDFALYDADYRYLLTREIEPADLLPPKNDIVCVTPACAAVLEGREPYAFESQFVYLVVRNMRASKARNITLKLTPSFATSSEQPGFNGMFDTPNDSVDAIVLDLPDLQAGTSLLVPVAAVVGFDSGGYRGYVGVGDTRKPVELCWRDAALGTRACELVRDIRQQQVYIGGQVPWGGGG